MKTRSIVALAAIAGFAAAAHAQTDTFTVTWQVNAFDVVTGDVVGTGVSEIGPGQGAELVASWSFSADIGATRTNHNNQTGPVDGFAKVFGDLHASAGHQGTFSPATDGSVPNLMFNGGDVTADALLNIQHAQLGIVGMPLTYTQNTLNDAFRIRWTPDNYDNRTVSMDFVKAAITNYATELYIVSAQSPFKTYASYRIENENFTGGSVSFQVVPAPASLALLGLGGLVAARRRR